jgi:hypothetical protein
LAEKSGNNLERKKIAVSHAGKQHSYHLAKALLDMDCLEGFYTSSYVSPRWLQDWFQKKGNTFFTRRFKEGLSAPFVHSHWQFELAEFVARKIQGKSKAVQDLVYKRDMDFDSMMARKMPRIKANIFWGFQGSCFDSLKAAKDSGKLAAEGWGSITRAIVGHSRYHLAHVYEAQLRAHALRRCPLVFPFAAMCSKLQPCIAIAALAGCDNQLSSNFGTGRTERRLGSPRGVKYKLFKDTGGSRSPTK